MLHLLRPLETLLLSRDFSVEIGRLDLAWSGGWSGRSLAKLIPNLRWAAIRVQHLILSLPV